MKKAEKRGIAAVFAIALLLLGAVPAYADIAYDPIDTIIYGIGPLLLILLIAIVLLSLIAGIVLLIVFSVRKKKRRAAQEKKNEALSD